MRIIVTAGALLAAGLVAAGISKAASPAFCANYVIEAQWQVKQQAALNCGFSGPRWTGEVKAHQSWCLNAQERDATNETRERDIAILRCNNCRYYSEDTMKQIKDAAASRCNVSGTEWRNNAKDHFNRCMGTGLLSLARETDARAQVLRACQTTIQKPRAPQWPPRR